MFFFCSFILLNYFHCNIWVSQSDCRGRPDNTWLHFIVIRVICGVQIVFVSDQRYCGWFRDKCVFIALKRSVRNDTKITSVALLCVMITSTVFKMYKIALTFIWPQICWRFDHILFTIHCAGNIRWQLNITVKMWLQIEEWHLNWTIFFYRNIYLLI